MLGINWPTIFFHIFNFALLVILLNELLYKPISAYIEKREKYYKDIEDELNNKMKESDQLITENKKRLEQINIEAEEIKSAALKESQILAKQEIEQAKETGQIIISKARLEAEREKENILRAAKEELKEVAIEAASKISLSDKDPFEDFIKHMEEE